MPTTAFPSPISASRFHCVIERAGDGFRLRDLKSSNGTFINGLRVESAELVPGEIVTIGATRLILVAPDSAENLLDRLEEVVEGGAGVMMLSEADVVEVEEDDAPPGPTAPRPRTRREEEDALIPVSTDDGSGGGTQNYQSSLRHMAAGMLDQSFSADSIALISARGQTVHRAGEGAARRAKPLICSASCS